MDEVRQKLSPLIRAYGVRPLAEKVGLHDSNIHAWMSGKPKIRAEKVQEIAQLFGYRVVTKIEKNK